MASAPQNANLPLFYNDLVPLNSRDHANYKSQSTDKATWLIGQHAVPLTVEEFRRPHAISPSCFRAAISPFRWR
jgi:hypothetical protein